MILAIVLVVLALIAAAAGLAWYLAGQIEHQALAVRPLRSPNDLVVTAVGDGEVTLAPTEATRRERSDLYKPGRYGISSADGNGGVGDILRRDGDTITRELLFFDPAIAVGDEVRLRALAHFGDPRTALGLAFEEAAFESDVGTLGAWHVPGSSSTWAIVIHGRAIDRQEGLKVVSAFDRLQLPTLVIQYRNDEGVAASASGFYDYGLSEWRDVEAAVRHAVERGAEDVVLVGSSMGGAIAVSFLYRSGLADRVRGVVLDSPILDFADVIDFGAERRKLWRGITRLGKAAASLRSGIAWSELDYLGRADELVVPVLLIHGDADRVVHVRTSDRLAAVRPDLVTYVRPGGVGHLRAWNVDHQGYERMLADFVTDTLGVR